MRFANLAQRLFNVPLVIAPGKAEVVMAALAERMGITRVMRLDGEAINIVPLMMDQSDENEFNQSAASRVPKMGYDVVGGVAIIEIEGTLVQKLGTLRPYSGMCGYDGIRQNFLTALTDPEVRAIMLNICSPGGEVAGCFDLVDLMYRARGRKPVWAVLDEYAYSGGYALASSADKIIVPRTGGTGSIGVIWLHCDFSKALTASGIDVTIISYGDMKSAGYPEIPLAPEAKKRFQADINTMGTLFDTTMARNRNMSIEAVTALQAGMFMGEAGVANGLADAIMAPDEAFRALLAELD